MCKLCKLQKDAGRLFLQKHPSQADSWEERCVTQLLSSDGVGKVEMDQCQLGQSDSAGSPIRKPTQWMSNGQHVVKALHKRCPGRGGWCQQGKAWKRHRPCYGAVAKAAAIYPFKMCRAILEGFVAEMESREERPHG